MNPHKDIKLLVHKFEKYGAIYFRVPKVASTSLLITLRKIDNIKLIDYKPDNSFKFTFVRNPFDRLASCYRHVIQKGAMNNIQNHPDLHRDMSFEEFVDAISKIKVEDMDIHFRPQYTFIPEKPDFIGKFENLSEDYLTVCKMIGIKAPGLLHENKTNKTIFKDYYTQKIVDKVVKLYKKDFELFKYNPDLPKAI
jgi:hypothetical protein